MAAQNGIISSSDQKKLDHLTINSNGTFSTTLVPFYPWRSGNSNATYTLHACNMLGPVYANGSWMGWKQNKSITKGQTYTDYGISNPNFTFKNLTFLWLFNSANNYAQGPITLNINGTGDFPIKVGRQHYGNSTGSSQFVNVYNLQGPEWVRGLYLLQCIDWSSTSAWSNVTDRKFYEVIFGPPLFYIKCMQLGTIKWINSSAQEVATTIS